MRSIVRFDRLDEERFPPSMNTNAVALITALLEPNSAARLGGANGICDLQAHDFFEGEDSLHRNELWVVGSKQ